MPSRDGADQRLGGARPHTVREAAQHETCRSPAHTSQLQTTACKGSGMADFRHHGGSDASAQQGFGAAKGFVV